MTTRLGVFLVLAVLCVFLVGRIDSCAGRRDDETTAESAHLRQLHAAHVRYRAKLERAERRIQASAAADHQQASVLRVTLAGAPPEQQRPLLVRIATADSSAYAKCSVALLTCQERATLAEQEARTLHYQLGEQMKVKDHRFGVFIGYGITAYATETAPVVRDGWQIGVGYRLSRIPFLP
jgi:hypothetical protein